jgi:hypothetical protein
VQNLVKQTGGKSEKVKSLTLQINDLSDFDNSISTAHPLNREFSALAADSQK